MTKLINVFMFSGQGSHYFQMGKSLFDENIIFREHMLRMDALVHKKLGYSIIAQLYNGENLKATPFDNLLLSHPAIFMVEYALSQTLIEMNIIPDIVLGSSLGSIVAATVAGCLEMEVALTAVVEHAQEIELRCEKGGMIAILSDPSIYEEIEMRSNCVIASYNFPNHFVVAANLKALDTVVEFLKSREIVFQRLAVSYPFHSTWMENVKPLLQESFKQIKIKSGTIPIACCTYSSLLMELPRDYFWEIARRPIRFNDIVNQLESIGNCRYIDVGPAGTLATFLKYTLPTKSAKNILSILTPFGRDVENLKSIKMKFVVPSI